MDKRLNFVLFQYFNTVGGPPRWADSAARRVAKNRIFYFTKYFIFLKIVFLIKIYIFLF
jgi:hypothetical protein